MLWVPAVSERKLLAQSVHVQQHLSHAAFFFDIVQWANKFYFKRVTAAVTCLKSAKSWRSSQTGGHRLSNDHKLSENQLHINWYTIHQIFQEDLEKSKICTKSVAVSHMNEQSSHKLERLHCGMQISHHLFTWTYAHWLSIP